MNINPKRLLCGSAVASLFLLALANCSAADSTTAPLPLISSSPTNFFSSWTGQSSNLSVLKRCPPWGCSLVGTVYVKADPASAQKERARQAVRNALASQRENQKREQRLQSPDLTSLQHVGLSTGTNSITIKP
jgi:hypothetical protein